MKKLETRLQVGIMVALLPAAVAAQGLTVVDTVCDEDLPICENGIQGLRGVRDMALTPEADFAYAPVALDDALVVFALSPEGTLEHVETLFDTDVGIDGLDSARGTTVSPDGDHVYVAALVDSSLAVFARDSSTGELTFVEVEKDGLGGVDGLDGANGANVAPSGDHVYVACERTSGGGDWLSVFDRDAATGELTFVESIAEEDLAFDYTPCSGIGPDNSDVIVSPDGSAVYAVNPFRGTVAWFDRDAGDGTLTQNSVICDENFGLDGIAGAVSVSIDPTGRRILTAASSFETVAVLAEKTIFSDGFESGDTTAWSVTIP